MAWGWFKKALKTIWGYVAPSAKKYAREGLDDFVKANIDEAFKIILDLRQVHTGGLDEFWDAAFARLKARNQQVADTFISRTLIDAYEHLKALEARGEVPIP